MVNFGAEARETQAESEERSKEPSRLSKYRDDEQPSGYTRTAGFLTALLGLVMIALPWLAGLAGPVVLGLILVGAGIVGTLNIIMTRYRENIASEVFFALILAILGAWMLIDPIAGAQTLTFLLGAYFAASGIYRLATLLFARQVSGRGWQVIQAGFAIAASILIFATWPQSALWLLGVLVGIEVVIVGLSIASLASQTSAQHRVRSLL